MQDVVSGPGAVLGSHPGLRCSTINFKRPSSGTPGRAFVPCAPKTVMVAKTPAVSCFTAYRATHRQQAVIALKTPFPRIRHQTSRKRPPGTAPQAPPPRGQQPRPALRDWLAMMSSGAHTGTAPRPPRRDQSPCGAAREPARTAAPLGTASRALLAGAEANQKKVPISRFALVSRGAGGDERGCGSGDAESQWPSGKPYRAGKNVVGEGGWEWKEPLSTAQDMRPVKIKCEER